MTNFRLFQPRINCKQQFQIENTVGKGEIAHYKQFLLFSHCFQKTCTADTLKPGVVWEKVMGKKNTEPSQ